MRIGFVLDTKMTHLKDENIDKIILLFLICIVLDIFFGNGIMIFFLNEDWIIREKKGIDSSIREEIMPIIIFQILISNSCWIKKTLKKNLRIVNNWTIIVWTTTINLQGRSLWKKISFKQCLSNFFFERL